MKINISDDMYAELVEMSRKLRRTAIGPVLYIPFRMIIKIKGRWVDYTFDDVQVILADMGLETMPVEGREWFAEGRGSGLSDWLLDRNIPYERKAMAAHHPLNRVSLFHEVVCENEISRVYVSDDELEEQGVHTDLEILWDFIWNLSAERDANEKD